MTDKPKKPENDKQPTVKFNVSPELEYVYWMYLTCTWVPEMS